MHPLPTTGIASFRHDLPDRLSTTRKTAEIYAGITRALRKEGRLIGTNDLWIAAATIENDMTLVTDNSSHFGRVPELRLLTY